MRGAPQWRPASFQDNVLQQRESVSSSLFTSDLLADSKRPPSGGGLRGLPFKPTRNCAEHNRLALAHC
jgi:hypothetical protein